MSVKRGFSWQEARKRVRAKDTMIM